MTMRTMRIALEAAQAAADRGETPVGAVVVDPAIGEVIAGAATARSARTTRPPTPRSWPCARRRRSSATTA